MSTKPSDFTMAHTSGWVISTPGRAKRDSSPFTLVRRTPTGSGPITWRSSVRPFVPTVRSRPASSRLRVPANPGSDVVVVNTVHKEYTVTHGRVIFGREDYWMRGQGVSRFVGADEFHKLFGVRLFDGEEATITLEVNIKA